MKHFAAILLFFFATGCAVQKPIVAPVAPTPLANTGGIDGSCSMLDENFTRRMLGRRLMQVTSAWLCGVTNDSHEVVTISQNNLTRSLQHLHPVGYSAMLIEVDEAARNGIGGRSIASITGIVTGANVATAAKVIKVSTSIATGAALFIAEAPTIIQLIRGIDTPVASNFHSLNTNASATLQPGGSASMYFFTTLWAWTEARQDFSIPVQNLPMVRLAQ